jgi:uncharacterized lipoprotein
MKTIVLALILLVALLAGCGPMTPERAAQVCEDRAQAAQGPTGQVALGVNSRSGGYVSGEIGVTSDFLRRRDPLEVYESCVFQQTGQAPIRPPSLRRGTYR